MKKIISIFCCVVMILTSCGNVKPQQPKIEIDQNEPLGLNLTTEQKVDDFEQYFNTIVESYPSLEDEKTELGIDFVGKKNFYLKKIKETKNDYEFFAIMMMVGKELHTGHTSMVMPSDYLEHPYFATNSEYLSKVSNIKENNQTWNEYISYYAPKYINDIEIDNYKYVNGKYFTIDHTGKYYIIDKINNKNVNDFIENNIFLLKQRYDFINKCIYRDSIKFNDKYGEKLNLTLQSDDGKCIIKQLYYSDIIDFSSNYVEYYMGNATSNETEDFYTYDDIENNIAYVNMNTFMCDPDKQQELGVKIKDKIQKLKSNNIIIDLRKNGGGYVYVAKNFLYPSLHSETIPYQATFSVLKSDNNIEYINALKKLNDYAITETENEYILKDKAVRYEGISRNNDKKIYYLVGSGTASTADEYASVIKDNQISTIIGTNTLGEGVIGGSNAIVLKNSNIIFSFNPCKGYNADSTDNSIYGTIPDIYCEQSLEDYKLKLQLKEQNENIYTYENMLKYDTVLKRAVEEIEKIQQ